MGTRRLLLVVTVVVAFVACSGEGVDVAKEAQRLLETDHEFAAASVEHGAAEAFRMYLAEDASMFSDGRHPVHGRVTWAGRGASTR